MYVFGFRGTDYEAYESWSELTLRTALKVLEIPIPENLKLHYEGLEVNITEEDKLKHFPTYYGEVTKVLTNIPEDVIDNLYSEDRDLLYKAVEKFVVGLHYVPDYEVKGLESIYIGDEECFLPTKKVMLGQERPFSECEAIEFAESTDLRIKASKTEQGQYKYSAEMIAILCRPKGEKYDEDTCLARVDKILDLTMDNVFEVFFCTIKRFNLLKKHTETSSLVQALREGVKLKKADSVNGAGTVGYSVSATL